jgi:hypothetical protein
MTTLRESKRPPDDFFGARQFYATMAKGLDAAVTAANAPGFVNVVRGLEARKAAEYPGGVERIVQQGRSLDEILDELALGWVGRDRSRNSDWNPPGFKIAGLAATVLIGAGTVSIGVGQWKVSKSQSELSKAQLEVNAKLSETAVKMNSETARKTRMDFAFAALSHLQHAQGSTPQEVRTGIVIAEYIMMDGDDSNLDPRMRPMIGEGLCILQDVERDAEIAAQVKDTVDRLVKKGRFAGCQGKQVSSKPPPVPPPAASSGATVLVPPPRSTTKVACKFPLGNTKAEKICRTAFDQINGQVANNSLLAFTEPNAVSGAAYGEFGGRNLLRYFYPEDESLVNEVAAKLNALQSNPQPKVAVQYNPQYRSSYPRGFFEMWVPPQP